VAAREVGETTGSGGIAKGEPGVRIVLGKLADLKQRRQTLARCYY